MSDRELDPKGWDNDEAGRYRRPRRPVEVRRPARWRVVVKTSLHVVVALTALAFLCGAGYGAYHLAATGEVFRLPSLDAVTVEPTEHVAPDAVRAVFAEDVGQSLFAVPLAARRQSAEQIPWVETATVERMFPHELRVVVRERTPVAFLRRGNSLWLVDAEGVILPPTANSNYSFPVLSGLSDTLSPAERAARVALYLEMADDLNRGGRTYTHDLSEVDLSDPENVRASVTEPDGVVWLYFGRGGYQQKYEAYLQHRSLWDQGKEPVRAVDLRYRGQIVLNPEDQPKTDTP